MNTTVRLVAAALASALLAVSPIASAHTDEYLATLKAPHDGQLRVAGPFHFELVVDRDNPAAVEKPVTVHVTDHAGTPVSTAGGSGTITLLGGGGKVTAKLVPAGDNAFSATAVYASTPDLKAVVTISFPGKPDASARFVPLAGKAAPAVDHSAHH